MEQAIKKWRDRCHVYYDWISSATFVERLLLSFAFSFLTGVSAQIFIKLPFTPVPVTGQVFVVLLGGALLGKSLAGLSQIIYFFGGMAGIPWFAAGNCGMVLLPSFGYIIGFIPAAFFVGWLFDRGIRWQSISRQIFAMLAGVAIIYCCGAIWFSVFMQTGLKTTLLMAVAPFIPVDIVKAYFAAYLVAFCSPRSFSNERSFKN
ncbi:MAG: biotin transporter BioY [Candidatus Omnitrophica bacterium]|nr:biotin transporter BioY [Candidatus Omnitrophota bacterium]MCM8825560.1 biotin transporter BioY [Candidatus Omnitrophota bacterium]